MGISGLHAELIVREHKFRPLPATVYMLGRQTVYLTYEEMLSLMLYHDIEPAPVPIEIDLSTSTAITLDRGYISDATFFGMLGVASVKAIDHSDFEGADIILDLNKPIPDEFSGVAEFLFGGSVLDNVFDPANYIQNICRLLSPGGRLIDQNIGSFHYHPYVIAAPAWYFDFFVTNGFADCKLYFSQGAAVTHLYGLDIDPDDAFICDFGSAGIGTPYGIIVVAEKGINSSSNRLPSQDQYRNEKDWEEYRGNLSQIKQSLRPFEVFGRPSPLDLARVPLRWNKSFRYLGTIDCQGGRFDGTIPLPSRQGIKIIEASYGLNLIGKSLTRPSILPVCAGNVTDKLGELLNGLNGAEMTVDVAILGDPAPELGKDLLVSYIYLNEPTKRLRDVRIAAEAHGKKLRIPPLT